MYYILERPEPYFLDMGILWKKYPRLSLPQRLREAFRLWIGRSSSHSLMILTLTSPAKECL